MNDDEMFIMVDIPGVEMSSHTQLEAGKLGNMTKAQKAKYVGVICCGLNGSIIIF